MYTARKMNNTKLSLLSILAITAFMIAAATLIPGNDAMAHKHKNKHKFLSIGNTRTTAIQASDQSQNVACGAGSTCSAANSPTNIQTQTVNSGSSFVG